MTEDEARAVVDKMRREAWLIALVALAVNLALITWNLTWGSMWWVPVHLIATAVIVYGIRRLIELERREQA